MDELLDGYDGPLEELRDILHDRDIILRFRITGIEWHGPCALVRGRLPSGQPCGLFATIETLLATADA